MVFLIKLMGSGIVFSYGFCFSLQRVVPSDAESVSAGRVFPQKVSQAPICLQAVRAVSFGTDPSRCLQINKVVVILSKSCTGAAKSLDAGGPSGLQSGIVCVTPRPS
jgi:hypothetical protein